MASTVWRGTIAFGLVSIPVRLVRAARRERVQFRQVYRSETQEEDRATPPEPEEETSEANYLTGEVAPVERIYTAATASGTPNGATVPASEILKGYEVEPARFVTFKPAEIKAIKPKTSTTIEIKSFTHLEQIDPIFFDASYYVAPQPAGEKPYSILFQSLEHSKFSAVGEMAMHGREHVVVLRPGARGLILETLFYNNEVHAEDQFAANSELVAPNELKMAEAFIHAMEAPFNPEELVDRYEIRMKELIESRSQSGAMRAAAPAPAPASAPVVDIMEALRQSLEAVRKPAAKETRTKRARRAS